MANRGTYPIDTTTDVGRLRMMLGDTDSKPLDPVEIGYQDYARFSDAQLQAFVDMAGGSFVPGEAGTWAMVYAYRYLQSTAASRSGSYKTYDLTVASTEADVWGALAASWQEQAEAEDADADDSVLVVDSNRPSVVTRAFDPFFRVGPGGWFDGVR